MEDIYINLSQTIVFGKAAGNPHDFLVLGLHGWSQRNGWQTWEPLINPLAAAGFYVVSVDMPGWGNSPPIGDSPLMNQKATAVVIEIFDKLSKKKAALMGKSWGGGIAVNCAENFPERISHLILTAPALQNYQQLESVKQPVLLAWAEDDPLIPIEHSKRFISHHPNTILVTYPSGGHSAAPKNADDFAEKAIAFLQNRE